MLRRMLDEDSTLSNESNNTPIQSIKSHDSKSKKRRSKISSSSKIFSNRSSQQYYKGHAYSYESEIVDKLDEPYHIPKSKKVPFSKKFADIKVIICYNIHRKQLEFVPDSIEELREFVRQMIDPENKLMPITINDFKMYFFDYENEKCTIDTQGDLESVYMMTQKAVPKNL